MFLSFLLVFLFGLFWQCSVAVVTNRTIDDTYGDPITGFMPFYAPASQWNPTNCTGCFVQPDPSQLFNGTRHDTTSNDGTSSLTLQFTGTAIYLFCVVPNTIPNTSPPTITRYDLQFTLDNAVVGTYVHPSDGSLDFQYKVPVLSVQNLTNTSHLLLAETQSQGSFFMFDFAMYTFDDGLAAEASQTSSTGGPSQTNSPSSSATQSTGSHTPIAAIVGGSVAGVVAIAVFVLALLFWKRSRRRPKARGSELALIDEDEVPPIALEISAFRDNPAPSIAASSSAATTQGVLPPYALTDPHASSEDLVNVETPKVVGKVASRLHVNHQG
ncbi:hypothetical protein FB45DRAFT_921658 [Roridomyces roridus]|uniref:Mid2 domain-containing protein n=1 Tax=Roridomyces roridus TaxID=1738132 RepID=A0AAD7BN32_9AGAR|nr:hypothetical protein FB45DRAFT_921658 [Roridomyces roridus]